MISPLFEMGACAGWSVDETRALVCMWSQNNVQNPLEMVSWNRLAVLARALMSW